MRIIQLHTRYRQAGGEDSVVQAEYDALTAAGHDVAQHLAHNPTEPAAAVAALAGSMWNPRAARRAVTTLGGVRPDVAHVHNTWFALSPSVLAPLRAKRVPVVMTMHNYRLACANSLLLRDGAPCESCLDRGPWPAVQHRCYRNSTLMSAVSATGIAVHRRVGTWPRLVDRFVVLSDFARSRFIRAGLPEDRMVRGSNFVGDPGPRAAPPSMSNVVLFVGRISAEKGLHVLLEAWRQAAPVGLRLEIIGDGPAHDELQLAHAHTDAVTFHGRLSGAEVMRRLLMARTLVIPSIWYEGQPVTALEGMAAGTPLLVSQIGGLPEVLGSAPAGTTFPPGDVDGLAEHLGGLTDDALVDARGAAARERYLSRYTVPTAVARLEAIYEEARQSAAW